MTRALEADMVRPFWTTAEQDWEDPIGRRRRVILTFVIGAVLGVLLSGVWGPGVVLGSEIRGDRELAAEVLDHLRSSAGQESLAVVEFDADGVRSSTIGSADGHWELGSVTKTFTGHLLADAVERGEVRLADPLHRYLPELTGRPAGEVTLAELATHHSGLPRVLPSQGRAAVLTPLTLRDPRSAGTEELIAEAGTVELAGRGRYVYSNLGTSLLGHALVRAAGQSDWATLARVRLLDPLGMRDTVFAATPDQIPANAVPGHQPNGRRPQPGTAEGALPAGCCTWTTTEDLTLYARAVLTGSAPGMAAVEPIADALAGDRIGLLWQETTGPAGQPLTWHRGETSGASSVIVLDRAAGRAVVALGNTATGVDRLGAGLIADTKTPVPLPGIMEIVSPIVLALVVWWTIRRAGRATRRTQLVAVGIDLVSLALLTAILGSWVVVPGWVHGLGVGIAAAGLLLGVRRSRDRPWLGSEPIADKVQVGVSAVVLLAILVLLAV
jgi:CubicO group peptidase (beta-lactamase class C family)